MVDLWTLLVVVMRMQTITTIKVNAVAVVNAVTAFAVVTVLNGNDL